jgi:hypothetical protein
LARYDLVPIQEASLEYPRQVSIWLMEVIADFLEIGDESFRKTKKFNQMLAADNHDIDPVIRQQQHR